MLLSSFTTTQTSKLTSTHGDMERPWPSSNNISKQHFVITHQLEENTIKYYRVSNSKVGSFKLKHFFSST